MSDKTLTFKTNINCGACVAKVKPFLDGNQHIAHWEVDTHNPDKLLTVKGPEVKAQEVEETLHKAGFVVKEGPLGDQGGKGFLKKLFGS